MNSKQIRANAWENLTGTYGIALLISFIGSLIISTLSIAWPFGLLVLGPVAIGLAFSFLKIARGVTVEVSDLFFGFENCFLNAFLLALLTGLFTFLWSLLLIVPGIIKALSYSMAPYILADNPDMDAMDTIKASQTLMKGNKWRLFCLYFSFIGWALLATCALGIGIILLMPYIEAAKAEFYKVIIEEKPV